MSYTAENIANIKASGNLAAYIEHDRKLVTSIQSAELIDDGRALQFAHFRGEYGVMIDNDKFSAWARVSADDFDKEWTGFETETAARAYARAALINRIKCVAHDILSDAGQRLAQLDATR